MLSFEFLFKPVEELDAVLTNLFDGAPLLVALGVAFLLGHLAGGRRGRRYP
jgi:hypothetical protein